MKVAIFSTKKYDQKFLETANARVGHELLMFEPRLAPETVSLAEGFPAVCVFVNDQIDRGVLESLSRGGTRLLALRSAGFNHVDVEAACDLGMTIVRVPAYSPHAVAEHAAALVLALNRKIHRAFNRVREGNFSLEGLLGFDLNGRTTGVIGTGRIGAVFAGIMKGFGCRLLAFDPYVNPDIEALGGRYVSLEELLGESDIVSLHCPLTPETHHLINQDAIRQMKPGAMLINTSRGAVIDTSAVIKALKSGQIGNLGLDVYEEEEDIFFRDLSERGVQDDVLARLLTFPNVIITGHQAFFTQEALLNIAETTLSNITDVEQGRACANVVTREHIAK